MFKKFSLNVATLFGLGRSPLTPGTIGSFFGILFYASIIRNLKPFYAVFTVYFLILVAIVICDIAAKEIGEKDPSCVIFDEFVAMPLCFFGIGFFAPQKISTFMLLLIGFVVFRIFDILKPFGIEKVQELSGGIGIVVDDLVAAVYTNITLLLICLTAS